MPSTGLTHRRHGPKGMNLFFGKRRLRLDVEGTDLVAEFAISSLGGFKSVIVSIGHKLAFAAVDCGGRGKV